MSKLDRYLLSELAQSTFAALVVLLIVSVGGVITDVLKDIASGRLPAGLMLAQLGLVLLNWLPLILPLALMLGIMIGVGRLYRDSEMPVIAAMGIGPRQLLRPVLTLVLPVVLVVALCSLWLGPMAERISRQMINEANRNLVISGLEPGSFTEIPGGGGVVYVGAMSSDGSQFRRIFIYRQSEGRLDVTTSNSGALSVDDSGERYLTLDDGFQVEGPMDTGLDYRLMRYASNEVRLPAGRQRFDPDDPEVLPTTELFGDPRRAANAQLHVRLVPPLLTLAFALLAIPLARTTPRQARYGGMMMGFFAYLIGMNLVLMGEDWLVTGRIAPALGLWWLVLPLLGGSLWLYFNDGRMRRSRLPKVQEAGP
ncbi:LPS export ABC transporter permease LptF [Lysobacter sp. A289]